VPLHFLQVADGTNRAPGGSCVVERKRLEISPLSSIAASGDLNERDGASMASERPGWHRGAA